MKSLLDIMLLLNGSTTGHRPNANKKYYIENLLLQTLMGSHVNFKSFVGERRRIKFLIFPNRTRMLVRFPFSSKFHGSVLCSLQRKQERIPAGCVPSVAVAVGGGVSAQGGVCLGKYLPRGLSACGVSATPTPSVYWHIHPPAQCMLGYNPPMDRILDTR